MKRRANQLKIPDIKVVRALTMLLGKLGIEGLSRSYYITDDNNNVIGGKTIFGWGLKETKDYVESKYDYYLPAQETETDKLRNYNVIHLTKRVRQTMNMLNKLGITSADAGLQVCKAFVLRRHN